MTTAPHLELYQDPGYFVGNGRRSGYSDYADVRGVLDHWSDMLRSNVGFRIRSLYDVGAAYGFVVENFVRRGTAAFGIEPSDYARSKVADDIAPRISAGALPDLPRQVQDTAYPHLLRTKFDLVTCTEVLEHVPEELVRPSLRAMARLTGQLCVSLIMLDLPEAYDDEGHICLKSRAWWEDQWDQTGMQARRDIEARLNNHPYSEAMRWSGRIFVRQAP